MGWPQILSRCWASGCCIRSALLKRLPVPIPSCLGQAPGLWWLCHKQRPTLRVRRGSTKRSKDLMNQWIVFFKYRPKVSFWVWIRFKQFIRNYDFCRLSDAFISNHQQYDHCFDLAIDASGPMMPVMPVTTFSHQRSVFWMALVPQRSRFCFKLVYDSDWMWGHIKLVSLSPLFSIVTKCNALQTMFEYF